MRTVIAIAFFLLYLFSTTELAELVKLPVLVHHYLEHRQEHKSLSFISFLKAHYAGLHKAEGNHHRQDHQQLPFKGHDHQFLAGNNSIIPRVYAFVQPSVYCEAKKISLTNELSCYSHFPADIWQPPRA